MILGFGAGLLSVMIINKLTVNKNSGWLDKSVFFLIMRKINATKK